MAKLVVSDGFFFSNHAESTDASNGHTRGGAIRAGKAKLTISDSTFYINRAFGGPGSSNYGGAIYSTLGHGTLGRNIFYANAASDGGALLLSTGLGGDHANGYHLINNTFVDNHADVRGGAVRDWNVDLVMRNNSFFANTSDGVSSIFSFSSTSDIGLWNNLFAAEPGVNWCATSSNTTLSGSHNIIPAADCGFSASANILDSDLSLQGYLKTFGKFGQLAFFVDSPALDGGYPGPPDDNMNPACPTLDGLGNPRVVDGNADNIPVCDIGAFEWQHEASLFADDFEERIQPIQ